MFYLVLSFSTCTVEKTVKPSPLNSRRSVRPADRMIEGTSTLKGSPTYTAGKASREYGRPLQGRYHPVPTIRRSYRPTAIER